MNPRRSTGCQRPRPPAEPGRQYQATTHYLPGRYGHAWSDQPMHHYRPRRYPRPGTNHGRADNYCTGLNHGTPVDRNRAIGAGAGFNPPAYRRWPLSVTIAVSIGTPPPRATGNVPFHALQQPRLGRQVDHAVCKLHVTSGESPVAPALDATPANRRSGIRPRRATRSQATSSRSRHAAAPAWSPRSSAGFS